MKNIVNKVITLLDIIFDATAIIVFFLNYWYVVVIIVIFKIIWRIIKYFLTEWSSRKD